MRTLATALAVAVAGCSSHSSRVVAPAPVLTSAAVMATTVTIEPAEAGPGDPILVRVRSVNTSSQPVRMTFSNSCRQGFEILNAGGVLGGPGFVCLDVVQEITVQPGEELVSEWKWNRELLIDGHDVTLPPGDYQIVGGLEAREAPMSAPVAFKLLAP